MRQYGNQKDAGCCSWGTIYKMMDGIVIAHQYCKCIMTRNGKQRTGNGDSHPFLLAEYIEDVFYSSKSQSYTDCIDDAVEVLIKIGILSQNEPKCNKFESLFGQSRYNKCLYRGIDEI